MVDVAQIEQALGRLKSVEAELGDPSVFSDRARYRAVLADYAALKRLDYAYVAYQLGEATERDLAAALLPPDPVEGRNAVQEALRYIVSAPLRRLFAFSLDGEAEEELSGLCETYLINHLGHRIPALEFYKKYGKTE